MKFSHDITDIMHDRPGRCDGVLDNSTMLTTAPDSQESQTAKFVDPTGAYGENPSFHYVAEMPLSLRYASLKRSILLLRSHSGFSP